MTQFVDIPTLQTDRLILRAPRPADVHAFAAFYGSDDARFVGGPLDEAQTWRYLAEVIGHWALRGYGRWIVTRRDDADAIGLIGLHHPLDWPEPEVGWYLWAGNGEGFATEAAQAARAYAYEVLDWDTIISLIDPKNTPSVQLAERLGARFEDTYTHPRFGDMGVWRHPSAEAIH